MSEVLKKEDVSEGFIPRRFHPGACFKCYSTTANNTSILRCSQCQLVSYCSKRCQRSNWSSHKSFCFVNRVQDGRNIFQNAKEKIKDWNDWLKIRSSLMIVCELNLKRKLNQEEKDIFLFPRVCDVCMIADTSILTECDICHSVFYCSKEHSERGHSLHSKCCDMYLLNMKCDVFETSPTLQDLPFPDIVDVKYQKLPSSINDLLKKQHFDLNPIDELSERVTLALITERLSYPLSLLYALEKLGVGIDSKEVNEVTDMRIHIIGATSSKELLGIIRWEYFLHRLPSLRTVHFVFIGPDLFSVYGETECEIQDKHCLDDSGMLRCKDCTKEGRLVVYEMAAMTYHEYSESVHYAQPDSVIAFNCGFHEYLGEKCDTWKDSLDLIVNGEIPIIFTSYTASEAKLDLEALVKLGPVETAISSHVNPFSSRRPYRDGDRDEGSVHFFSNQYITCIKPKK